MGASVLSFWTHASNLSKYLVLGVLNLVSLSVCSCGDDSKWAGLASGCAVLRLNSDLRVPQSLCYQRAHSAAASPVSAQPNGRSHPKLLRDVSALSPLRSLSVC